MLTHWTKVAHCPDLTDAQIAALTPAQFNASAHRAKDILRYCRARGIVGTVVRETRRFQDRQYLIGDTMHEVRATRAHHEGE